MLRLSVPNISDDEIIAANSVLRSGNLVHGEECNQFEKELAEYLGVSDVVVVSSGTAALHLSLVALGIGEGDAVIVPDFTFPATVNVVELVGATPIFVDVSPNTYNIIPEKISEAIENWDGPEKVSAIMPVHEFGCPADMTKIMAIARRFDLKVVEDAACALGAVHNSQMIGGFGDAGCFSFHPRKSITTGEGGAICTKNPELAENLRLFRSHGIARQNGKITFELAGYNYRLTNFQASLGRSQLAKFSEWLDCRRALKCVYDRCFEGLNHLSIPENVPGHSWQTYMVVLNDSIDRSKIIAAMMDKGIETNMGAQSVIDQPAYSRYREKYPEIANSLRLFNQGLALPFCETYTEEQISSVAETLIELLVDQK